MRRRSEEIADSRRFDGEYDRMKRLVRENLWNEHDGIYENRYWDGRFSPRLSPTNFYPLLAGVATSEQAARMVREHLLNNKEFWGTYVIPTIARNDSAFADQFYWRGDIWGPTNYLVYQGLNRYGFDEEALAFAEKSYALFMDDWKAAGHTNENYHAWGGNGGGDTHYTWGALLCLVAIEQYIDENPWEGLRFGALDPPADGEFYGALWANRRYDVAIGPHGTALRMDGKPRFEADRCRRGSAISAAGVYNQKRRAGQRHYRRIRLRVVGVEDRWQSRGHYRPSSRAARRLHLQPANMQSS